MSQTDKENIPQDSDPFKGEVQKLFSLHKLIQQTKEEISKEKSQQLSKPQLITTKLIQQQCGLTEFHGDDLVKEIGKIRRLRLENLGIGSTDNLEWYSQVTHIYLQHNKIKEMGDVWLFMGNLEFLAMFDNQIEKMENLKDCSSLKMLDLRNNKISRIDVSELPKSLQFLFLQGNDDLKLEKKAIAQQCPTLVQLDDDIITLKMRKEWGLDISSHDQSTIELLLQELKPVEDNSCQQQIETAIKLHGKPERPSNRAQGHNSARYEELKREQALMASLQKTKNGSNCRSAPKKHGRDVSIHFEKNQKNC
jgi:Leucine-rich repeat (LRR) protein